MLRLFSRSKSTRQSARRFKSTFTSRSELLEARMMLAGDLAQNVDNPLDVNNDGHVTARDAVIVSWTLGTSRGRGLAVEQGSGEPVRAAAAASTDTHSVFLDVTGDGVLTDADLSSIVNALNNGSGEPGDVVTFHLRTNDVDGNPITSVDVGDEFVLQVLAQDTQATEPEGGFGVFAPYLDVEYNAALASVVGDLQFSSTYSNGRVGDTSVAGLINEVGAFANFDPLGNGEVELFSVRMRADSPGTLSLTSNQADGGSIVEIGIFGSDDAVDPSDVLYGSTSLTINGSLEGDPDLVAFAKAIADAGVELWTSTLDARATTAEQLDLFGEGQHFLPIKELFEKNADDPTQLQATSEAEAAGRTSLNQWVFPDGTETQDLLSLADIAQLLDISIPSTDNPSIVPIDDVTVLQGSPLHIPLDGYDPNGDPLTYTVTVGDGTVLDSSIIEGNRSIIFTVEEEGGYLGEMMFELFEGRASRATDQMIALAESGFYEDIIFHRVANEFVIQGGDPLGTGRGGSDLGTFDDQFHVDLQHNVTGLLSMAKTDDDTNNSQFFVTEGTTRHLDFNHTIFGQLVEGERVRETISNVDTNGTTPVTPVSISSATVIEDNENAVVMLSALQMSGSTTVTVTAMDPDGNSTTETFNVTLAPDDVDFNDSPPFLEDFGDQVFGPGEAAEFQVNAVDVEGDPIVYEAFINSNEVNINIDDNGFVTVDEFVGTLDALIRVSPPGDNPRGFMDEQFFTITIGTDGPSGVELLSITDSGSSDSDKVTNISELQFEVTGVVAGSTVVLLAGGEEIGREVADGGESLTITTSSLSEMGSGSYEITAAFEIDGELSLQSPATTVVFDQDAPAAISNTVPTSAVVGSDFIFDVEHDEEGAIGTLYSLTNAPVGMQIDEATGELTWLPTGDQHGMQTFDIVVTDLAGNATANSVTIDVVGGVAALRLVAVDENGNEISTIPQGSTVEIQVYIEDQRANPTGAGQAFVDVAFDDSLASVDMVLGIQVASDFSTNASTGTVSTGLVNGVGGSASSALGAGQILLTTIPLAANSPGTLVVDVNANDAGIILFDQTTPLADVEVAVASVTVDILEVTVDLQANDDAFTVEDLSGATTLDVLRNDTLASDSGIVEIVSVVGLAAENGSTATISDDGSSILYTPGADFAGEEEFTYVIRDSQNISSSAVVTVSLNRPPEANDDLYPVDLDVNDNRRLILIEDSGQEVPLPVLGNDVFDTEREQVAVTEVSSSENATIRIIEEALSVLVGYTPNPNFSGEDTFTYTVQDTGNPPLSDTATVTVIVAQVNDPPVVTDDVFDNVEQGKPMTIPAIEILGNDSAGPMEDDQQIAIVGFASQPKQGTVVLNDDGSITYTPNVDATGTDTVSYVIQDNGVADNPVTLERISTPLQAFGEITFNIIDANQAPNAFDDARSLVAGTTGRFDVLENDDDDGPANLLTITAFDQGDNGGTVTEEDGLLVYTPDSSFIGTEIFTYTISDGELTDVGQVTVTVTDPNNSTNSSFSGSVYFDSDNNGVMGADEQGIGGVVINLTGTDNNGRAVARQATTKVDGSYSFQTLPKGTYEVTQVHPTFLLDGIDTADDTSTINGNDSFSITVGDDEVTSDGNMFAERGLSLKYSMLDSLSSERRPGFLTAVTNGQSQFIRNPKGWDDYSELRVTMSEDDSEVTILATDKDSQLVQVTVSATDRSVVQLFGREADTMFLRIVAASADLDLQPVA